MPATLTRLPRPARCLGSFAALCWLATSATSAAESPVDFNREIRPLLSNRCFTCHGPDEGERKAGLRLDVAEGAFADLGGYAALMPRDAAASELYQRLVTDDEDDLMPPPGKGARFTEEEAALVRRWIEQGAPYAEHWSYEKPSRPVPPEVPLEDWARHPVDRFVLARLESEGLAPSPKADRHTLARRIALDLTGLPPSWEETLAFVEDPSGEAVERYVERQLAKPAFGERWAKVWLDLARYADSAGYADDPLRTIWAYRDWVIRSLNDNLPFDRFTIEQIAGDLLEEPDDSQIIATAFHRNTLTNNEGGTNDEEFRNVAVVDRVNTTMAVWMGTTMACAQCHTHKYDPLTHLEYFQIFDFFNQSTDADKKDESPVFEVWTEEQKARRAALESEIAALEATLAAETPEIAAEREAWLARWQGPFAWAPLPTRELAAERGKLSRNDEGWIVRAPAPEGETEPPADRYELVYDLAEIPAPLLSGLQLEIAPEQRSNFVLSRVVATLESADAPQPVQGRYVRISLPGEGRILQLAEVEVHGEGTNLARGAEASASSVYRGAGPERAVDGNTDGDFQAGSVFHSATEDSPWLEIDLGAERAIDEIRLWNRTDGGDAVARRLSGYTVSVLDAAREERFAESPPEIPTPSRSIGLSGRRTLGFSLAAASYEQPGFAAADVLGETPDAGKGWAIAGGTGEAQDLVLVFDEALETEEGVLRLTLVQESKWERHLLRHFRVSGTSEFRLSQWAAIPAEIRTLLAREAQDPAEERRLAAHFQRIAPSLASERALAAEKRAALKALEPLTTVPVMQDLPPEERRETFVHLRGDYQSHGEKAEAGVPAVFHPLREDLPRNRLALAHWLVDEENPLTPRVVANRFWEQLFGRGLVETSEEFGSQGSLPSHPELLDWLAVELREGGWDVKGFLKRLVTSQAYLQSSRVDAGLLARDPENELYARGPRFRASAETVRDQALALSGLLSPKRYGPPARPPQPELGLRAAFGSATDWETSEGEDRYRRGLYTQWRRSNPYPSMATFDAPNREVCTVKRNRSNTPLQALVTLNDPVYVEAAQAWGRRAAQGPGGFDEQLAQALRETLSREPAEAELSRLAYLHAEALAAYREDPEAARLLAEEPLGPLPEDADPASLAAWTVVGNVVLNLDELIMKR